MNTLNIVKEKKAQILAEKLITKLQEIIDQISNTHGILVITDSFSTANKCNKQFKNLVNIAAYYMIVADNLTTKYQKALMNAYSIKHLSSFSKDWEGYNIYLVLTAKVKEISETLNKIQ